MVKHIILWKLKEDCKTEAVKRGIKESLEALYGKIDGLLEIKVECEPMPSSNADVMLYSVFEDEAALGGYAIHPEHVKAADTKVRPFTAERFCFDYEVN